MSSAYGKINKPDSTVDVDSILPIHKVLRDGTNAVVQKVDGNNRSLVDYLHARFNAEIEGG
jgi:hypothetical protein